MHWLTKNAYQELHSVFSGFQLSSSFILRLPQLHAYSHVMQNVLLRRNYRISIAQTCRGLVGGVSSVPPAEN